MSVQLSCGKIDIGPPRAFTSVQTALELAAWGLFTSWTAWIIMSKPSAYSNVTVKKVDPDDHLRRTRARIQQIQSHLSKAHRGSRLKGKVCIITGVGSMKGIGYVNIHKTLPVRFWICRQPSHSFTLRSRRLWQMFTASFQSLYKLMCIDVQGQNIFTWLIYHRTIFLTSSPRSRNRTLTWKSAWSPSVTNFELTIFATGYRHWSGCSGWRSNSRGVPESFEWRGQIGRFLR